MMKHYLVIIFTLFSFGLMAQNNTITGKLTNASDGQSIPGVTVVVKGLANVGTLTDMDGNYSISVPKEAEALTFSFVGMITQTIEIKGQTVINVQLETEDIGLEEVVVVGYNVMKKSLVTGSIAKVSGADIAEQPNLRVTQALQGKTSGVVITNNSGQPGDQVSVRIRGIGTNGDAEPLYIVDGLPLSGAALDFLSTNDIESIEVLKDAAAAAIYGARGANGVVLITTKKGTKNNTFTVSYDAYYGQQNPWRKLDVLNSDEYMMIMNEAALNAGQAPLFDQAAMDSLSKNSTDWQDEMFYYNAPKMNHAVSFSGGNENTTYSSSLSFFQQDGIVAEGKSNYQRFTYRLNVIRDFNALQIGSNINFANISNKGIAANDQYAGNSLIQALNTPPIVPVTFADGTYATPTDYGVGIQEITNPIAMLNYQNSETTTNKLVGNVYAKLDFGKLFDALEGLTFKTSYGTEFALVGNRGYTPLYYLDAMHQTTINSVNASMDKYITWNFENTLIYSKDFGKNTITTLLGNTQFKNWYENIGGSKNDVIFDAIDYAYLDNAQDPTSDIVYGGFSEHTLLSYFGRVNYDFDDKYMLSAVLRADGSSRFGAENKFGYFPAVSAGWVISREGFMSNLTNTINLLKLRASWGQNGNENIGDFRYTSVMGNGAIYYFGIDQTQYNGTLPTQIANPLLRWETSQQTDLGLDMGFLNDKITLSLDYYIKETKDWLVDAPAPLILGNVPPTINGGAVKNSGLEFDLGFKQSIKDFNFNVSLTGAFNKNEVTAIENEEQTLKGGTGGHGQADILYAEVGSPLGVFYGVKTDGIFQNQAEIDAYVDGSGNLIQPNAQPGDFKFVDEDGDGSIGDGDRVILGDPYPDFTGGLSLSANWKGIDFNAFVYVALGQQIWDATRRYDLNYTNYRSDVLNRWTGEGTSNDYPRVTFADLNQNWKTPSDFFVKDADYMRVKNISLGYTIPTNISELAKISKLRVYVAAENPFTFTKYKGYDVEIGGGVFGNGIDHGIYPQARTILGGINITF